MIGQTIAHYRITAKLGEGGMGAVYQGTDTKLHRDVAIKVMLDSFADDTARLDRFTREAQTLASLNHPNIAAVYGIEERAIVMELVEGPTLADRLAQGPLGLAEALAIARQIADALEAAHEKGIIHRDLKPANVKVTPDGKVKVLDFGLAKLSHPAENPASAPTVVHGNSPTLAGVILGTVGYMAPEQARGYNVDKRADIWAFGVVLFEMLSGRRAFTGETVSDALAAVLNSDPDWSALPASTPPSIKRLLRRCLERERQRRLHDIADARLEIDEAPAKSEDSAPATPRGSRWWPAVALAAMLLGVGGGFLLNRRQPEIKKQMIQFKIGAPAGARLQAGARNFAIAPDDGAVVFRAVRSGERRLWLRTLGNDTAGPLQGTADATQSVFSPDGRSIAFYQSGKLKRLQLASGSVDTLCDIAANTSFTWSEGDVILFSKQRVIHSLNAAGGEPVATRFRGVRPRFLPGGSRFLYIADGPKGPAIHVASLDGSLDKKLLDGDWSAEYGGGSIFYWRPSEDRVLRARGFDLNRLEFTGEPVIVAEGLANMAVLSPGGTLVFEKIGTNFDLQLVDRSGKLISILNSKDKRRWGHPNISADGSKLVGDEGNGGDLWLIDIDRGVQSRLTSDRETSTVGVFSLDGSRLYYRREGKTPPGAIYEIPVGGTGTPKLVWQGASHHMDISPDGKTLIASRTTPGAGGTGLIEISLVGERKERPFSNAPFIEDFPRFSPDGKWVAYHSVETGSAQVYIQSYPPGAGKLPVSRDGGVQPYWRADGKELYFISQDRNVMACEIRPKGTTLEVGACKALFQTRLRVGNNGGATFAAARSGQRFVISVPSDDVEEPGLHVIMNWQPSKGPSEK